MEVNMKTRPINDVLYAKLKTVFEKKLEAGRIPVQIRDIIAYQVNSHPDGVLPIGEFNPYLITNDNYDVVRASFESEFDVIVRMVNHIKHLTIYSILQHLKDNFVDANKLINTIIEKNSRELNRPLTSLETWLIFKNEISKENSVFQIHPQKLNNITRLSSNEFSFYPNVYRGPLTIAGLNLFVDQITEMAQHCPENLHLILASLPVKTAANNVHNIVVFAECGKEPKIHVLAKAHAAMLDPVYPNTLNREFTWPELSENNVAKLALTSEQS